MPTLDPNQDHRIERDLAVEMTERYRNHTSFNGVYGGFFGKTAIEKILNQAGCVGIRYYHGLDSEMQPVLILVGVTESNSDMVTGELAEMSLPCPDVCDLDSPLRNT